MRARRATVLVTVVTTLLTAGGAGSALADGDPASDVLLFQDAYLPYFPAPSRPEVQTLTRLLGQVRRDGYPMKVALIQSNGDLGANPDLLGRPADYAELLESELTIRVKKPHLVIVMAEGGLAGRNLGPEGEEILDGIAIDTAAESDGLVRAAIQAVSEIATANGHETALPEIKPNEQPAGPDDGRSHTALYVLSAIIVALGLALIAFALLIRGRRTPA